MTRLTKILSLGFLFFLLINLNSAASFAADICVDDLTDSAALPGDCDATCSDGTANCNLRDAIAKSLDGDRIFFQTGLTGTYTLIAGETDLVITTKSLKIEGPGANLLTIDAGDNYDNVFNFVGGANKTLEISGLTLTGATVATNTTSAAIRNANTNNTLTLMNSVIDGNIRGILNSGKLNVMYSTISNNNSVGAGFNITGTGIFSTGSDVNIMESTISGNQSNQNVGGLDLGAQVNPATVNITNTTVSGNMAPDLVGGMRISSVTDNMTATLNNVTIANNSTTAGTAGGLYITQGLGLVTTVNLNNSLLGDNTGTNPDCELDSGTLNSNGFNLVENTTNCGPSLEATDITGQDPQLVPLADNGGDTQTHNLKSTSPAVDAADPENCPPPAIDQRDQARPLDGKGDGTALCDIGALEAGRTSLGIFPGLNAIKLQSTSTPNSPFDFEATVSNSGPDFAPGVEVSTTLPSGVSFVSGTIGGQACTVSGQLVTCILGALAPGESANVIIQIQVGNSTFSVTLALTTTGNNIDPDNQALILNVNVNDNGGGCSLGSAGNPGSWILLFSVLASLGFIRRKYLNH